MSFMVLLGIALIAFSPVLVLVLLTVAQSAELVVLLVCSAFFWLLSILVTSILWFIISPIRDAYVWAIFLAVALQEVGRWATYRVLKRAEPGLLKVADFANSRLVHHRLAYVSGLGFGIMSALIQFNPVLSVATGPGMLPSPGCTGNSYYLVSAFTICCFSLLHVFWHVVFSHGMNTNSKVLVAIVPIAHLAASLLTLINESGESCAGALVPLYIELALFGFICWRIISKRPSREF
ncbi:hypothetical protein CAOG_00299 [Capsaspora owczarzaki ATCC 30864]|uniref:Gamma-secretase subunit Aph-1 n=1 Tax=Capsaspora owczarzaki (strain ATCC 30864) TaxID=595528 RepID=A0A0D2U0F3_CAPO3|nr:hypothetical protein CAOG_00299 [Capsaspora owczarzaki ATCC 30864]KJE88701.1 hypothetical protein CAOG_000299 [Capsaspora owczarzaki ATCC 30864]|eukprot:XP_004365170.1 hypothetical protein CAOG_00299 [Capsaspora owczarzaki ATCC 30864]